MFNLTLETRNTFGKKLDADRKAGKLPIAIYGPKEKAGSYFVNTNQFSKVYKQAGESSIIALEVGGEEKDALIHDVAVHPVTGVPLHADFYVIEKGKKLQVKVPLEFTGVAPAVKVLGGVLVKVMHELEIEAMPRSLPHGLKVDISKLATFEDQIHIKDIALPEGVVALDDGEEVVALVSEPKEEKIEEEAPVDLSKIETTVDKGKKPEEGAEGEAAEAKPEKK
ncbi:MAG: 50S ribosomal protein L25 [Candidatus Paceibacterota bacterium]|jgi:large subunit ribosomal protein L25